MKTLSANELTLFLSQVSSLSDSEAGQTSDDGSSFLKRLAASPSTLADQATEKTYESGSVIFEEGEEGNALYLVLDGQIAVIQHQEEGRRLIAVRGTGEIFGEMALVEKRPRMATAAALSPVHLLCITKTGFNQLLHSKPEFGLELMRILSNRLRAESHRQPASRHEQRDALTGVYTRSSFEEHLHQMVQRGETFSFMLVDLDHFKSINDGFGHMRGDETLKEFTRRAHSVLRDEDFLFRYGGDEFCLLLPGVDGEQATTIARRILSVVREKPLAGNPPLTLTLSIGLASFPADTGESVLPADLIKIADHRVYQAKRAGRARVVGASNILITAPQPDSDLTPEISRLIEREQPLEIMQNFFAKLESTQHGGLWVRGTSGCGQSRFLREVAANARLRNYAVFTLSGAPELQKESYGVMRAAREAQHDIAGVWISPKKPTPLAEVLALTLPPFVAERQNHGVLIVLDNADWADPATCGGLQQLLKTRFVFPIGLAYAATQSILTNDIYQEEVELRALSMHGTQLWLRHHLGWEAPQDFVQRLHQSTEGKPARLQQEMAHLVKSGELTLTTDGWVIRNRVPNKKI